MTLKQVVFLAMFLIAGLVAAVYILTLLAPQPRASQAITDATQATYVGRAGSFSTGHADVFRLDDPDTGNQVYVLLGVNVNRGAISVVPQGIEVREPKEQTR